MLDFQVKPTLLNTQKNADKAYISEIKWQAVRQGVCRWSSCCNS